jgi:hypothetical protein
MDTFPCHDCGVDVEEASAIWLAPPDGRPDESAGEPYCAGCARPLPLAA